MPGFNIGFAIFPDLTQLDFTGPLQVLARLPRLGNSHCREVARPGTERLWPKSASHHDVPGLSSTRPDLCAGRVRRGHARSPRVTPSRSCALRRNGRAT